MKPLYLFVLLLLATAAGAQRLPVNGFLLDSITHLPIAGGKLTNASTNQTVLTDNKGFFNLQAAPNDVIYALAASYQYDTVRFSFLFTDTLNIYLSPTGDILPNVTVSSRYNKYQLDSIARRTNFEESRGSRISTVSAPNSSGFGVGINLDRLFKKKYQQQKSTERLFNRLEESSYIDFRFSPKLVAYYTGLKGDALREFMYRYTPTYQWLRQHPTNDDVLWYINDKLKEYKAGVRKKSF